jgi:hypothetical protein
MHWFRSYSFGSWCALIALALQLVVSFGHVHRGGKTWAVGFSLLATTTAGGATAPAATPAPKPVDVSFDYCGICTVINLAGTLNDPYVSYWRWYSNNQGGAPNADVFTVDV